MGCFGRVSILMTWILIVFYINLQTSCYPSLWCCIVIQLCLKEASEVNSNLAAVSNPSYSRNHIIHHILVSQSMVILSRSLWTSPKGVNRLVKFKAWSWISKPAFLGILSQERFTNHHEKWPEMGPCVHGTVLCTTVALGHSGSGWSVWWGSHPDILLGVGKGVMPLSPCTLNYIAWGYSHELEHPSPISWHITTPGFVIMVM